MYTKILHSIMIHHIYINRYRKGVYARCSITSCHTSWQDQEYLPVHAKICQSNVDPRACILDFEKEAVAYDKKQKLTTKSKGLLEISLCCSLN